MSGLRENIIKNIKRRYRWWFAWLIVLLLVDEYLKEGYVFKISDIGKIMTHETLVLLTTLTWIVVEVIVWLRRRNLK